MYMYYIAVCMCVFAAATHLISMLLKQTVLIVQLSIFQLAAAVV